MNTVTFSKSCYFSVKDTEAFKRDMREVGCEVFVVTVPNETELVAVAPMWGEWPDDEHTPFTTVIASHLCDGEVAVLYSVGYEGNRYVFATATAVNHKGETIDFDITDIKLEAHKQWGTYPRGMQV